MYLIKYKLNALLLYLIPLFFISYKIFAKTKELKFIKMFILVLFLIVFFKIKHIFENNANLYWSYILVILKIKRIFGQNKTPSD